MKFYRHLLPAVLVAALYYSVKTPAVAGDAAERILYNARIFTAEPDRPYAEAVAIRGDKIVAVGNRDEVARAADKESLRPLTMPRPPGTPTDGAKPAHRRCENDRPG